MAVTLSRQHGMRAPPGLQRFKKFCPQPSLHRADEADEPASHPAPSPAIDPRAALAVLALAAIATAVQVADDEFAAASKPVPLAPVQALNSLSGSIHPGYRENHAEADGSIVWPAESLWRDLRSAGALSQTLILKRLQTPSLSTQQ